MQVTALKIGKADAFVLTAGQSCGIIDTGETEDGSEILDYLKKQGVVKVDWLIITHFDKDHVGGAPQLLQKMQIGQIYQPAYAGNNEAYELYVQKLKKLGVTPENVTEYTQLQFGDALIGIYPPEKDVYGEDDDNNHSLVIRIEHGENRLLFTGDAEQLRLQELLDTPELKGPYRVLKVAHHGRWNDLSGAFLDYARPECAWITCSKKNPADPQMLKALTERNIPTYLTVDGDIACLSNGVSLQVSQR